MTIIIAITSILLLALFIWMGSLSAKKKHQTNEKAAQESAYHKAIERQHAVERKERVYKAETGHLATQLFLAKEAEKRNPREALHWYEMAANQDDIIGMHGVIRICALAPDNIVLQEKAKFWQLAVQANSGDQKARMEMAIALMKGRGINADVNRAIAIIEELAHEDYVEAQLFMGDWYVSQSNTEPSPKQSSEWYFKAAENSSIEGQIKLGLNYLNGVGVNADHIRASYWLELAAEQGSGEAQYHAGSVWMGRSANGNAIAYMWFYLADHFGYEEAKSKRDDLGNIIGVNGVISLQSMIKPLIKKFKLGEVEKHTLIHALNKLYDRPTYFPDIDGNEFMVNLPKAESVKQENLDQTNSKQSSNQNLDLDYSMSSVELNGNSSNTSTSD